MARQGVAIVKVLRACVRRRLSPFKPFKIVSRPRKISAEEERLSVSNRYGGKSRVRRGNLVKTVY